MTYKKPKKRKRVSFCLKGTPGDKADAEVSDDLFDRMEQHLILHNELDRSKLIRAAITYYLDNHQ